MTFHNNLLQDNRVLDPDNLAANSSSLKNSIEYNVITKHILGLRKLQTSHGHNPANKVEYVSVFEGQHIMCSVVKAEHYCVPSSMAQLVLCKVARSTRNGVRHLETTPTLTSGRTVQITIRTLVFSLSITFHYVSTRGALGSRMFY